jgi:hypothetical protein
MFNKKYKVLILNSKWEVLEKNVKLNILPRQKEYIWTGTKYYQVINLVHDIKTSQQISIIVEDLTNQELLENQEITK